MSELVVKSTVIVSVETHLGARYVFPDVPKEALKNVPESGRIPVSQPSLQFINVSFALLSLPLNIVKSVRADDEEIWASSACLAEKT